jgi:hypothetical protein
LQGFNVHYMRFETWILALFAKYHMQHL